jgi:hypothetical protein
MDGFYEQCKKLDEKVGITEICGQPAFQSEKDTITNFIAALKEGLGYIDRYSGSPIAIFTVIDRQTIKLIKIKTPFYLPDRRKMSNIPNLFTYNIFMGADWIRGCDQFDKEESEPHKLDMVLSYYDDDNPTAGGKRLGEFVNRMMGLDLPGDNFPNYSWDDIKKISWHLNRENFNREMPAEGSISKYPIVDGKPVL